jgi:hypothetical protein
MAQLQFAFWDSVGGYAAPDTSMADVYDISSAYDSASSSPLASCKSRVSNPSVNQP